MKIGGPATDPCGTPYFRVVSSPKLKGFIVLIIGRHTRLTVWQAYNIRYGVKNPVFVDFSTSLTESSWFLNSLKWLNTMGYQNIH